MKLKRCLNEISAVARKQDQSVSKRARCGTNEKPRIENDHVIVQRQTE